MNGVQGDVRDVIFVLPCIGWWPAWVLCNSEPELLRFAIVAVVMKLKLSDDDVWIWRVTVQPVVEVGRPLPGKCLSLCGVTWFCVLCVLKGDLHATSCNWEVFTEVMYIGSGCPPGLWRSQCWCSSWNGIWTILGCPLYLQNFKQYCQSPTNSDLDQIPFC